MRKPESAELHSIDTISLFPEALATYLNSSIMARAQKKGCVVFSHVDLRSFGIGPHQRVDDTVYGGGPGMVLTAPVVKAAIASVRKPHSYVIHLSAQGEPLTQRKCFELAQKKHLILVAGHYEGIDERAIELCVDEEICIGDYILTNGALAALVLIDSVVRLLEGVLGDADSARQDSFVNGLLDCPHYTRPLEFEGISIPEVLKTGDHEAIATWRQQCALSRTSVRRPDLYFNYIASQRTKIEEMQGGALEIVKISSNIKSMERFLKHIKVGSISLEGFTLAKGDEKAYPVLFIYTLSDRRSFERCYALFLKEQKLVAQLQRKEGKLQACFIDREGVPWVLVYKEERDDGNE